MAGRTPFFGLSYFDFRDRLDLPVNVRKEIDRFLLIDKQLYGLYSVFGNGVLSGWQVSINNQSSFSINIGEGIGIIGLLASETTVSETLEDLPPNETLDIYATTSSGSEIDRQVNFVASRIPIGTNSVRICRVTTSASGILDIDNTYREEIGFIEIIKDEIAKHKHRGSPTKIDLRSETRNQLPSARVEDFDASKITTGRFDAARLPIFDHNDLENNGLLSHAALDSFARLVTTGNRELLGEISSVNLMKLLLAWKYDNPALEDGWVNNLTIIPGITDDSLIDFENSNSVIDILNSCISGRPMPFGQITSIFWDTTQSFLTTTERDLVIIAQDTVSLSRGSTSSQFVENFEQVPSAGVSIPGFTAETIAVSEDFGVTSEGGDSLFTEGFYSGKFDTQERRAIFFRKPINNNKDWTDFDEIYLDVKTLFDNHAAVYMYFVNEGSDGVLKKSSEYLILAQDEITENPDPALKGFERRVLSIENEERDNIKEIIFYSASTASDFHFYVDNIFMRSQQLFPEQGFVRYRYSSQVPVIFNAINYESDTPDDTQIKVRAKIANSPTLLKRATFTNNLNSGDVFALEGTDIEIDVQLLSNEDQSSTPVLRSLELQMIVTSEINGFSIDNADQWDRGTYENAQVDTEQFTDSSFLRIKDPVNVDNMYYSFKNVISEVGPDPDRDAFLGFQGESWPYAPKEVERIVSTQGQRGLNNPVSVYRLPSKDFIIADLENDRVILADQEGNFKKALASHNESSNLFLYASTAVFNPRTGILSITFSQSITLSDIDITKFRLWISGTPIDLGLSDELGENPFDRKILEIKLSLDKSVQLLNLNNGDASIQIRSGAFPVDLQPSSGVSFISGTRGLPIDIADIVYVQFIRRPVFANITKNNKWLVGNSSIFFDAEDAPNFQEVQVKVNATEKINISVDDPGEGFVINWSTNVPASISSIVSFTSSPPGNEGVLSINSPSEDLVGQYNITLIANYVNADNPAQNFSSQTDISLQIVEETGDDDSENTNIPTVAEFDFENGQLTFAYDSLFFSDFSLGGVYEIDEENILISGIIQSPDSLKPSDPGDVDEFTRQAISKLADFRGVVISLNKNTSSINFQYNCSDGTYASDAVVDINGNYVVAETTFTNNTGRVVKIDSMGNIVWQIGGGLFTRINDVRSLINENLIIST